MTHDFKDLHVVVTGGAGALGSKVVQALAERGAFCHVPVHGDSPTASPPQLKYYANIDLASETSVTEFYSELPQLWASIHLAGGFSAKPLTETTLADFQSMIDTNLATAFLCCREAARAMRSHSKGGRIVNVAARPALMPTGGMVAYAVSKAAVASLTRNLAEELKKDRILVNAVAPSIIDSPANRAAMPNAKHDLWPTAEEIANAILYLASPGNSLTSGDVVPVFGFA